MNVPLSPHKASQRATLHILAAAVVYLVLRALCTYLLAGDIHGAARVTLALLPTLPMLWIVGSVYRYLMSTDELVRRVHVHALAFAAGLNFAVWVSYGLLEETAGFPYLSARWGAMFLGLSWAVGSLVLWRRYK